MTAPKATRKTTNPPEEDLDPNSIDELRHFSIEKTAEILGVSVSWLAKQVAARAVPCTFIAGKAKFAARHIREISAIGESDPALHGRKSRTRKSTASAA